MITSRGNFINNQWIQGEGPTFTSIDPANGKAVWEGYSSSLHDIEKALEAARSAFDSWRRRSLDERIAYLKRFGEALVQHQDQIAETISRDVGKPLWESKTEVASILGKIEISIEAYRQRCPTQTRDQTNASSVTRHKPHGVMAVLGPFNFPGHLPHGHIIPALLAGNTVVFKPSEQAPSVAEFLFRLWEQAELPEGVINMVQGRGESGKLLAEHPAIDGLLFTGSAATGKKLSEFFGRHPEKILALEMGGNNPLVVSKVSDLQVAVQLVIQSAYLTSGQRCTCARRLILVDSEQSELFIQSLISQVSQIRVGPYTKHPEPFMGPVISEQMVKQLIIAEANLISQKGVSLVELKPLQAGTGLISPGLIDMTDALHRPDGEIFGPLLQLIRVPHLTAAIKEANNTVYGLSAGILSDSREEYEQFFHEVNAGVINWNMPLTGASSAAPFGGVRQSGNHRPSAFYAADYCNYPVASLESEKMTQPKSGS
jgi:succinylglutamic semialdehyde dehydrogenase